MNAPAPSIDKAIELLLKACDSYESKNFNKARELRYQAERQLEVLK